MNNKKDIEEDIKAIRKLTGYFEFFLKTIIEDKRFTEIKEKNGVTEQKYKKTSFSKAIENILADRERLEKENVKMQVEIAEQVYFESMPIEEMKQLQVKANAYDSLVEKIKNKIQKYKKMKDNCNDNEIETKIRLDVKIIGYEELLDTEK